MRVIKEWAGLKVVENKWLKPGTAYLFYERRQGPPVLVTSIGYTASWRFRFRWWWMICSHRVGLIPKNLAEKFRPR